MSSSARLVELRLSVRGIDELIPELRKRVPGIAREATIQIERDLPDYARSHDARYAEVLAWSVEWSIGHFVDLMGTPDLSSEDILAHFRRVGVGEAREGRSLEPIQAAFRIGAGVAVRRLTEESELLNTSVTSTTIAQVAQAVFSYLDRLIDSAAEGHAETSAQVAGELQLRRRRLLDALVDPEQPRGKLRSLAADADWPMPAAVAAVALRERRGDSAPRPSLAPDILVGLHLDEPCLIVPDPEGPGRRRTLEAGLKGWTAAIGPAVAPAETATSLILARQALDLVREGVVPGRRPVVVTEHLPIMIMSRAPDLAGILIERKLGPLLASRPTTRGRLAETFLSSIECGFNATEVATRLHVHAQTIRYRIRQLEAMFGESLYDPAQRLEFHLALRAWLTSPGAGHDQVHQAAPPGPRVPGPERPVR
ncbi:PucR family transcriptional regulator [Spirillospora sp. CA-294931]|uniref:PucR family transcriptional regulator n=1 Tax=Spirillospora sp. CA-294931 TaxID=3240042 RepID=UPI003D908097